MIAHDSSSVLQLQLLLQFGDRLRRLRKARKLSAMEVALQVGISRTTLAAVEAGDPAPSIGTYLRVMTVLGVGGDLAMLAGDALGPAVAGSAAARSRRPAPSVQVIISVDTSRHQVQDLQSLALHEEAVRQVRAHPELLAQAQEALENWLQSGSSHSTALWLEWREILAQRKWRKALGRTRHAQQLRQASPLVTILPAGARNRILAEVNRLKAGVHL
jgi:transcriptional regulator with XRE-family HTH domain